MWSKLVNLFRKWKCRKIYKQLPEMVKMQLYLEMCQPENANESYNDILERELYLKSEVDRKWEQ